MRRPFQLALAVIGVLVVGAYLAPGPKRYAASRTDRMVVEAGQLALMRGLEDAVRRKGPPVLWGDRLNIASQCDFGALSEVVDCKVRFDRYPNPDRWCLAEYRVGFPGRYVTSTGAPPVCGTYSDDGDPLPKRRGPGRLTLPGLRA